MVTQGIQRCKPRIFYWFFLKFVSTTTNPVPRHEKSNNYKSWKIQKIYQLQNIKKLDFIMPVNGSDIEQRQTVEKRPC